MAYLQTILGGERIPDDVIAQYGGNRFFADEVEDWIPTPNMPQMDQGTGFKGLPSDVREALTLAMSKTLEKITGYRVKVYLK